MTVVRWPRFTSWLPHCTSRLLSTFYSGAAPTAASAMALQVAANLSPMFPEAGELVHRYAAAKKAGFSVVECSLPYSSKAESLAAALHQHGLKQVLINTNPGQIAAGKMGFACAPGEEEHFKESLEQGIAYAKALGCNKLHIMVGVRREGHDKATHRQVLEANLQHAVQRLVQEDITGLLEPKNPVTFPGYFLDNFDTAVEILDKINSPHLRLLLDIFHLQLICGNVTKNIERLMPYTGHVQVSQAPHRKEPSSPGELDYVYIIRKLQEAGYKGYIGAEYTPSTPKTEDSLSWIEQCGLTL